MRGRVSEETGEKEGSDRETQSGKKKQVKGCH